MLLAILVGPTLLLSSAATMAQVRGAQATPVEEEQVPPQPQPLDNRTGRITGSAVGDIGQRETRESAAVRAGIKPMARIANRIQNRVQNRIRNRIDRNYNPRTDTADPFAVAEDQARTSGRPR